MRTCVQVYYYSDSDLDRDGYTALICPNFETADRIVCGEKPADIDETAWDEICEERWKRQKLTWDYTSQ